MSKKIKIFKTDTNIKTTNHKYPYVSLANNKTDLQNFYFLFSHESLSQLINIKEK